MILVKRYKNACWSSSNAFVSEAGGMIFKSRASQIEHSVANASPTAATFLQKELCFPGVMPRKWTSQTRCTLWRNTACIMKDLILIQKFHFQHSYISNLQYICGVCFSIIHLISLGNPTGSMSGKFVSSKFGSDFTQVIGKFSSCLALYISPVATSPFVRLLG